VTLVFGVVHLLPLATSPRFTSRALVLERALADTDALVSGGVDGLIVENFGDAPFYRDHVPPSTIAEMTAIIARLRAEIGAAPKIGVNVLRNDGAAALSIAAATGASFVRVNVLSGVMFADQGQIEGRAAELLRLRRALEAEIEIFGDVAVKHALPPPGFSISQAAKDTAYRALADALIVTGTGTGEACELEDLRTVRKAVPDRPLFVGSGVTAQNIGQISSDADGVIVGTSLKRDGRVTEPVDPARVRELISRAATR
jgi:membrane complex biogenesis BtpA family protein